MNCYKILIKNELHSAVFVREGLFLPKLLVMWVGQGPARGEKGCRLLELKKKEKGRAK